MYASGKQLPDEKISLHDSFGTVVLDAVISKILKFKIASYLQKDNCFDTEFIPEYFCLIACVMTFI